MGGNGDLKTTQEKTQEVKPETKPEEARAQENPKPETQKESPKEIKIAEIWVKDGQLVMDASPEFWMDKLRALGVLEMCKDIVKNFNKPEKSKIISATQNAMLNFARRIRGKR